MIPEIFDFLEGYSYDLYLLHSYVEMMEFMWTILFYEWQKKTPATALITLLFLILQVAVSQRVGCDHRDQRGGVQGLYN